MATSFSMYRVMTGFCERTELSEKPGPKAFLNLALSGAGVKTNL